MNGQMMDFLWRGQNASGSSVLAEVQMTGARVGAGSEFGASPRLGVEGAAVRGSVSAMCPPGAGGRERVRGPGL